ARGCSARPGAALARDAIRGPLADLHVRAASPRARGAPGRDPDKRARDACLADRRPAVRSWPAPPLRPACARVRDAGRLRGDERALDPSPWTGIRRLAESVEAALRLTRGGHRTRRLRNLAGAP